MFSARSAPSVKQLLRERRAEEERIVRPGSPQPRPKPSSRAKPPFVSDGLARFEFFGRRAMKVEAGAPKAERVLEVRDLLTEVNRNRDRQFDDSAQELAGKLLHDHAGRPTVTPGEPAARGGAALYERCMAEGYSLLLTADGSGVAAVRPGGGLYWGDEAITAAAPLIAGYMRGQPARCELKHTDGQAPEAWTVSSAGHRMVCRAHVEATPSDA